MEYYFNDATKNIKSKPAKQLMMSSITEKFDNLKKEYDSQKEITTSLGHIIKHADYKSAKIKRKE